MRNDVFERKNMRQIQMGKDFLNGLGGPLSQSYSRSVKLTLEAKKTVCPPCVLALWEREGGFRGMNQGKQKFASTFIPLRSPFSCTLAYAPRGISALQAHFVP